MTSICTICHSFALNSIEQLVAGFWRRKKLSFDLFCYLARCVSEPYQLVMKRDNKTGEILAPKSVILVLSTRHHDDNDIFFSARLFLSWFYFIWVFNFGFLSNHNDDRKNNGIDDGDDDGVSCDLNRNFVVKHRLVERRFGIDAEERLLFWRYAKCMLKM